MSIIYGLVLIIFVSVGLSLLMSSKDHYVAGFFKMFASTGFILLCVQAGGINSAYGLVILAGLILSWWGDLFLISKSAPIFMIGLVAFLLAHVAYCIAFVLHGIALSPALYALGVMLLIGAPVVYWLYPYLGKMRVPVLSYMGVITLMVVLAAATAFVTSHYVILAGAFLFYGSDIFVARDRFVSEHRSNAKMGLPMYYLGQILLAFSVIYGS